MKNKKRRRKKKTEASKTGPKAERKKKTKCTLIIISKNIKIIINIVMFTPIVK